MGVRRCQENRCIFEADWRGVWVWCVDRNNNNILRIMDGTTNANNDRVTAAIQSVLLNKIFSYRNIPVEMTMIAGTQNMKSKATSSASTVGALPGILTDTGD